MQPTTLILIGIKIKINKIQNENESLLTVKFDNVNGAMICQRMYADRFSNLKKMNFHLLTTFIGCSLDFDTV